MMFLRYILFASTLSDAWAALKAIYHAARTRIRTGRTPKTFTLPNRTWAERFWSAMLNVFIITEVVDFLTSILSRGFGLGMLAFLKVAPDHAADVVEWTANQIISFEPLAARLAAVTMQGITGIDIDPGTLKSAPTPEAGRERAIALGGEFMRVVSGIFDINAAQEDFQTRTGVTGSAENLASYFGTNLFFQLRSLTISTVASLTGWPTLRHLEQLHQSVNWAFGFGWLSWAVMSEYMNVTINPGMRRLLNSSVKPNDYSEAEARWAVWSGRLSPDQHDRVMDNQGVRLDIRQALLDRAEADLSDTDLADLWRWGKITRDDLVKQYRLKGYGGPKAELKVHRIETERLHGLLEKVTELYLRLYRDCVITAAELELHLSNVGWTQNEIDIARVVQELDRRQRRWLSDSDLNKAADLGFLTIDDVFNQLECQGMTLADAAVKVFLMLETKIPQDCIDKVKPVDVDKLFRAIIALIQTGDLLSIPGGILKLLKCLGDLPDIPEPPGDEEPTTPAQRLPTGSLTVLPSTATVGDQFRLVWNIDRADTVTIDQGIGTVPAQGVRFLTATVNTIWILTATNEDGTRTFQASLLVRPRPVAAAPKIPLPSVSLSVTPSRTFEGEQIAIEWETANADQVFLDDGNGPVSVSKSGAKFGVADHSRVFTVSAAGPGGQRQRSDSQVVRPMPDDAIPKPAASVTVSPGRATVGDRVEVRWSSANADLVTLEGVAGTETVSPSGARVITAVSTIIVTLRARNVEANLERISQDALIVEAAEPDEPRTAPAPIISLTIRPSRAKRGTIVAIEWRTANATLVELIRASGRTPLDPVGATTITAQATETFILRASGPGGERSLAKVLIVE